MKILIVSATTFEIRPLLGRMVYLGTGTDNLEHYQYKNIVVDVLVPGIGILSTAYSLGKLFSSLPGRQAGVKYDAAINAGICGTFPGMLHIGDVAEVTEDCVAESGAEDQDRFYTIFELGLTNPEEPPYKGGRLINRFPILSATLSKLPKVKGITVNTIHGRRESIHWLMGQFNPALETMEGAAFLYGCLTEKIPSAQVRAVSNIVEEHDRSKWNLDLALKRLNITLEEIMKDMTL